VRKKSLNDLFKPQRTPARGDRCYSRADSSRGKSQLRPLGFTNGGVRSGGKIFKLLFEEGEALGRRLENLEKKGSLCEGRSYLRKKSSNPTKGIYEGRGEPIPRVIICGRVHKTKGKRGREGTKYNSGRGTKGVS